MIGKGFMDFAEKTNQIRKNRPVQEAGLIGFYHAVFVIAIVLPIQRITHHHYPFYFQSPFCINSQV
jgi:hypothetical protein